MFSLFGVRYSVNSKPAGPLPNLGIWRLTGPPAFPVCYCLGAEFYGKRGGCDGSSAKSRGIRLRRCYGEEELLRAAHQYMNSGDGVSNSR